MIDRDRTDASGLESARPENSPAATNQTAGDSILAIPPLVTLIGALLLLLFTLVLAYWSHILSG